MCGNAALLVVASSHTAVLLGYFQTLSLRWQRKYLHHNMVVSAVERAEYRMWVLCLRRKPRSAHVPSYEVVVQPVDGARASAGDNPSISSYPDDVKIRKHEATAAPLLFDMSNQPEGCTPRW